MNFIQNQPSLANFYSKNLKTIDENEPNSLDHEALSKSQLQANYTQVDKFIQEKNLSLLKMKKIQNAHIETLFNEFNQIQNQNNNINDIFQLKIIKNDDKSPIGSQQLIDVGQAQSKKQKMIDSQLINLASAKNSNTKEWTEKLEEIINEADKQIGIEENKLFSQNMQKQFVNKKFVLPDLLYNTKSQNYIKKSVSPPKSSQNLTRNKNQIQYQNTEKTIETSHAIHRIKDQTRNKQKNNKIKVYFLMKLYDKAVSQDIDDETRISMLFQILSQTLGQTDFMDIYEFVKKEFENFIFNEDHSIIQIFNEISTQKLSENKENLTFKNISCSMKQGMIEWKQKVSIELEQFKNDQKDKDKLLHQYKTKINSLQSQLQSQTEEYTKHIQQIQSFSENRVEDKNRELEKAHRILLDIKEQMHKINEKSEQEKAILMANHENLVKESNIKIYELKQQIQMLEGSYDSLQEKYDRIRNVFEKSFLSLKLSKEQLLLKDDTINNLLSNMQSLEIRAAINFDDLTPRPDLSKFEDFLNINLDKRSTKHQMEQIYNHIHKKDHKQQEVEIMELQSIQKQKNTKSSQYVKRTSKVGKGFNKSDDPVIK